MDAQGALESLLGRLGAVLVSEAQLLGGVRGDVEFIKDEMESMNGLLLHLMESMTARVKKKKERFYLEKKKSKIHQRSLNLSGGSLRSMNLQSAHRGL